jgi:hypothetical protein
MTTKNTTLIIPVRIVINKPAMLRLQDYLEEKLQSFFEPKRKFLLYKAWPIWAKTLGSKISDNDCEADIAATIRSAWVILHVITCTAIIANCLRHW